MEYKAVKLSPSDNVAFAAASIPKGKTAIISDSEELVVNSQRLVNYSLIEYSSRLSGITLCLSDGMPIMS